MKAKDTLLLNNTITQNPIWARRAWFWHVASHKAFHSVLVLKHAYHPIEIQYSEARYNN